MRTVLARLVTVVVSAMVAMLLCETLLRSGLLGSVGLIPDLVTADEVRQVNWRKPGKPFVWRGQLGKPKEFEVHGTWNSRAYNDSEYSVEKPPGTVRILVLGDSYVEAVQVAPSKSFHNLLEARLNSSPPAGVRYEVIALGTSGMGPRRSLETLRNVGLAYQPDVVIEEFLGFNDISDDSEELGVAFTLQMRRLKQISSRVYLPELWTGDGPWAKRLGLARSRMAVFLGQSWNNLVYKYRVSTMDPGDRIPHHWFAFKKVYDPASPYEKAWIDGWATTPGYLRETKKECDRVGARFLLVRFTDRWRAAPGGLRQLYTAYPEFLAMEMDFERDARMLEGLAQEETLAYLDLFPDFRANWTEARPLHFPADTHWNEAGHEVAEEAIYRRLRELGWVP